METRKNMETRKRPKEELEAGVMLSVDEAV